MNLINESYTLVDLEKVMEKTRRAIQFQATKEQWPIVPRQGRGGGNAYPFATLPAYVKAAILAKALGTKAAYIHDVNLDEKTLKANLNAFQAATDSARKTAEGRAEIIAALDRFISIQKTGFERGAKTFAAMYAQRLAPGLTPEIYQTIKSCQLNTLRNWRKAFQAGGLAALLPKHDKCGRQTVINPDMQLRLVAMVSATPHVRGARLVEMVYREFPENQRPDRATIYRWLDNWKKTNKEVYTLMSNPAAWKNKYQAAFGSLAVQAQYAGHYWQMDSTPADVMTRDGHRCAIVAAIDVYSRRVVLVVAPTSKKEVVGATIRKGILAWGVPKRIDKDNGTDYASKYITAVTSALGIDCPKLPTYGPEHKGNVERFFGTLTRDLEEMLPGFTGHSVAERAALREQQTWGKRIMQYSKDAVPVPLTMGELMHMCEAWLDVYEDKVHSGFADEPGRPLKGLTPRQAFEQSAKKPPVINDPKVLDILLAKIGNYTVQKSGLRAGGGRYVSAALVGYIGERVTVKFNDADAGSVFVYHKNKFVCEARDEALTGQSLADYMEAVKSYRKKLKEQMRAAKTLSDNTHKPYTLSLMDGYLTSAAAPAPAKAVMEFRPELDTPAVKAAKETVAHVEGRAVAQDSPAPAKVLEFVKPEIIKPEETDDAGQWEKPPVEFLDNAIKFYQWFLDKEKAVGLSRKEAEHKVELWETYREIRQMYEKPENNLMEAYL